MKRRVPASKEGEPCSGLIDFVLCPDLFLAKFDPTGQTLLYSTYLGTGGADTFGGLAVDGDGNAWVAGTATGPNPDDDDAGLAFVIKVDASGSSIVYTSSLGGTNLVKGLAVDSGGNAFLTGVSERPDFGAVKQIEPAPTIKSIYATSDGGVTWRAINAGIPAHLVHSLAIDPRRTTTMYAGTPRGLYKTVNGGGTWTRILPAAVDVRQVVIGANSSVYASDTIDLARSDDGGETWTLLSESIPRTGEPQIGSFAVDPTNPEVIWVTGPSSRTQTIRRTEDGGRQWKIVKEGVDLFRSTRTTSILLAGARVAVCCFGGPAAYNSGLHLSEDGGKTWTESAPAYVFSPLLDPLDPRQQTIYAPSYSQLLRSTDFGRSWEMLTGVSPGICTYCGYLPGSLAIDPRDGSLFLVGGSGLLLRSSDRGRTWSSTTGPWGPHASMLALDPVRPASTFYVASWTPEVYEFHRHAFVAKLDAAGAISWATLLGGSHIDEATAIAVDREGNPVVAGRTNSPDFPAVGALQPGLAGDFDAFLTKIAASGERILSSTYLGGLLMDAAEVVAVDRDNNVYLTGSTSSQDFPSPERP